MGPYHEPGGPRPMISACCPLSACPLWPLDLYERWSSMATARLPMMAASCWPSMFPGPLCSLNLCGRWSFMLAGPLWPYMAAARWPSMFVGLATGPLYLLAWPLALCSCWLFVAAGALWPSIAAVLLYLVYGLWPIARRIRTGRWRSARVKGPIECRRSTSPLSPPPPTSNSASTSKTSRKLPIRTPLHTALCPCARWGLQLM